MKRNNLINVLIMNGNSEFDSQENEKQHKQLIDRTKNAQKWIDLKIKAKAFFDKDIQEAIEIPEAVKNDFYESPDVMNVYFEVIIDGCAPIMLFFEGENGKFRKPIFRSPNIIEDEEGKLIWNYGISIFYQHDGFPDTRVGIGNRYGVQVFETSRLDLALADAARKFDIMQEFQAEIELKNSQKEFQYENLDGSEPLPDLVLLNNLRALIKEEVARVLNR